MKKFKLFKEIFYFSSEHLKGVWALFSTIFGIVYSMLARIEVFLFLFTFSCLVSFYFLYRSWAILHRRVIDVEPKSDRNFYIMMNDFVTNLDYYLQNNKSSDSFALAVGIDFSLNLDNSSSGSILGDLIVFLEKKYCIDKTWLQNKIYEAYRTQYSDISKVKFGDIIDITLKLEEHEIDILFVVNSRKKQIKSVIKNDVLDGEDSRVIIIKLFKRCNDLKIKSLMLGAIGTNKLYFPYKIIITEIINAYVYCIEKQYEPQKIYLSLREEDMIDQGLVPRQIINYISQAIRFISKKE